MRRAATAAWISTCLAATLFACSPAPDPSTRVDFAMLAQGVEGFSQAEPGYEFSFPRDHGSHPDFRIEWWYLTANLQDAAGQHYGAQWTLFRIAMLPGRDPSTPDSVDPLAHAGNPWLQGQVFMAHAAVTWPRGHAGFQRYARSGDHDGVAQSGVRAEPFAAWLDNWSLRSTGPGWLPLRAVFEEGDMGFDLRLDSDQPLVLQGDAGFSQKHPSGSGSYYYSQPFLRADGTLMINGEEIPVSGQAWLDREWSSQFLQPGQVGWDWFALHLDSGEKLMLFRLREASASGSAGKFEDGEFRHGVLLSPTGVKTPLASQRIDFEVTHTMRLHGRQLPAEWRIHMPEIGRELRIRPLVEDQWMNVDFAYWEGAIEVMGSTPGTRGRGYLEMTGYPPE